MQENIYKRTYFLPKKLMDVFSKWCNPGRDYSPKIAAAIAIFMQLPPDLRELAEKIAYEEDIDPALFDLESEIKERLSSPADKQQLRNEIISILKDLNIMPLDASDAQKAVEDIEASAAGFEASKELPGKTPVRRAGA